MALAANGHIGQEQLGDERERTSTSSGYVEIVELNDRAYFKAELLDINPDIRQCYVRYERPRSWSARLLRRSDCVSFVMNRNWI
jgi:hypothetical protein